MAARPLLKSIAALIMHHSTIKLDVFTPSIPSKNFDVPDRGLQTDFWAWLDSCKCYRAPMHRWSARFLVLLLFLLFCPYRSPAPFVYRPGEGWTYEPVGGEGKWQMTRAEDQLAVAQAAFDKKAYRLAIKAARRVVRIWPHSDYVAQA